MINTFTLKMTSKLVGFWIRVLKVNKLVTEPAYFSRKPGQQTNYSADRDAVLILVQVLSPKIK